MKQLPKEMYESSFVEQVIELMSSVSKMFVGEILRIPR